MKFITSSMTSVFAIVELLNHLNLIISWHFLFFESNLNESKNIKNMLKDTLFLIDQACKLISEVTIRNCWVKLMLSKHQ